MQGSWSILDNGWHNMPWTDGQWSSKLTNPSNKFFLQFLVNSVEDVNKQIDSSNISYARKARIYCSLAYSINGT